MACGWGEASCTTAYRPIKMHAVSAACDSRMPFTKSIKENLVASEIQEEIAGFGSH